MMLRCHTPEIVGNWSLQNQDDKFDWESHPYFKPKNFYDSSITCVGDRGNFESLIIYAFSLGYILFWIFLLPYLTYK